MSVTDGDRLMEEGGKASGDISHRLCPVEEELETGNVDIDEEELEFDVYGYIIIDGVADKSYREPGSMAEQMLKDVNSMSEEEDGLVGERDAFGFYIMSKEIEFFEVLVPFDPSRTLVGGHVVCHSPESSASGDAAGFWQ